MTMAHSLHIMTTPHSHNRKITTQKSHYVLYMYIAHSIHRCMMTIAHSHNRKITKQKSHYVLYMYIAHSIHGCMMTIAHSSYHAFYV